jgi:Cellulase (glycosyl hydrolase family 5)
MLLFPFLVAADAQETALANYVFVPGSARDLSKSGTWLRDSEGRYVLLRGVNFGSRNKLRPYIPVMPLNVTVLNHKEFEAEMKAVRPYLCQLRTLGMNVVRLPIMWKALEPTPNPNLGQLMPETINYLKYVKEIIDELYSDGLFVIVDFHQDIAHEAYGGDGFPDWALGIDDQHPALPISHKLMDSKWGTNYYDVPWLSRIICRCAGRRLLVRNTLESFWIDELYNQEQKETDRVTYKARNPQTHFVKIVGQVVKFFATLNNGAGHPAILGYEPFNEPSEVGLGKQNFEENILPEFYHRVEEEIGKYDDKALVFIEPRSDWTVYSANGPEFQGLKYTSKPQSFLPAPYVPNSANSGVFSFHYYDPWMMTGFPFAWNMNKKAKQWPSIFEQLHQVANSSGLVPFLTEFGCSQDWEGYTRLRPQIYHHRVIRACMDLQFKQVEAQMFNATYWNYDLYNQKNTKDNWNGENYSLLGPERSSRNLDVVARPYTMRSSAIPQRIFFDLESENAAFILAGAVVDAPTVIFVPRTLHYFGDDFEVRATTPPSSVIWDETNHMLYWYPDKTLPQNQLIVSRSGGFNSLVLPADSQALLPQTGFCMIVGRIKKVPIACAATHGDSAQSFGSDSTLLPQNLGVSHGASITEIWH